MSNTKRIAQQTPTEAWALARFNASLKWEGKRSYNDLYARAQRATIFFVSRNIHPQRTTTSHLLEYRRHLQEQGFKPSNINKSMVAVSGMLKAVGNTTTGGMLRVQRVPQWWLTPIDLQRLVELYSDDPDRNLRHALDFVVWTTLTGLRVEESLRLQRLHFVGLGTDNCQMHVPGGKNRQATEVLPLGPEASDFAAKLLGFVPGGPTVPADTCMFRLEYEHLRLLWQKFRATLGASDVPTATLKSLRRSFAKRATDRGMPTEVLRRYLRHSHLDTTLQYLNVVGGYDGAVRKWL